MMEKTAWGGVGGPRAIGRNHRNWTEPRRVVMPSALSGMDVTTSCCEGFKFGLSWKTKVVGRCLGEVRYLIWDFSKQTQNIIYNLVGWVTYCSTVA